MTVSKRSRSDRARVGATGVDVSLRESVGDACVEARTGDASYPDIDSDRGARAGRGEDGRNDDVATVRDAAIRLLAQREHSLDELRRKLQRRGYASATITHVVESLDAAHSVSDVRFAESFVRVRSERGQGPLKIRAELRERGVGDDFVDDVMTATADFWLARAQKTRSKRFGIALPVDRDAWNRQARFLAQRGYPADLIYRTLGAAR